MIGRSHGIHAEPITFGLVFARWHYAEVRRGRQRLAAPARPSPSARSPAPSAPTPT
jgi:adenylosuccinate lyase